LILIVFRENLGVCVWLQADLLDQIERLSLLGVGRGIDLE
jgi:hypothetical protein